MTTKTLYMNMDENELRCRMAGFNDDEIEQLKSSKYHYWLWNEVLDYDKQSEWFLNKP